MDLADAASHGEKPQLAEIDAHVLATLLLQPPAPASGVVSRLQLIGAHVTGRLQLQHARIDIPISFIDCYFDQSVELDHAVLRTADFSGCRLPELRAAGIRVDRDLILARLATCELSLFGAAIGGNLWLNSARIGGGEATSAVHGAQLQVGGGIYARSIQVSGTFNLWGAHANALELEHARLSSESGSALRGDGLTIDQDLHCSDLTVTNGGVRLFGAKVGGQLWLNYADISNTSDWAVSAPMISVGGGIYGRRLTASGGVNLFGAAVGESAELSTSTLISHHGLAFRAPGARFGGGVALDSNANISGGVILTRAEIKGTLAFSEAKFAANATVDLRHAMAGKIDMVKIGAPPAVLDLRGASVANLHDEPDSWPTRIELDRFNYQSLSPLLPARRRLTWLSRGSDSYHPQPYEHLAAHYRGLGHDHDARTILLARHRLRRRSLQPLSRLWEYLEDATIGYGYRPGRALLWLLSMTAIVAAVFSSTPPRPVRPDGPHFQPTAYAVDLILPILDLGQEKSFIPLGITQWIAWASTLAGWLLTTTVLAGITRRLTRSSRTGS